MKTSWLLCLKILCLDLVRFSNAWTSTDVSINRRQVVAVGTGFLVWGSTHPHESTAAAPVSPAEAVRRSASSIPGYGSSDVFYPRSFVGSWNAVRELLPTGLTLEYPVRFLSSIEDNAVVADRGWNQANLEKAICKLSLKGSESEATLPSYSWSETNPNDLRITFADGNKKEVKVTKRATEKADETVFSSEFQRVTQEDARGIPVISARRVISKWRIIDASNIEGIEVVYDAGGGDPLMGSTTSVEQNKILSKSRITLQRP